MKYTIDYSKSFRGVENRVFKTKRETMEWLMNGMTACEGAEAEHYKNMYMQFVTGNRTLFY